LANFHQNLSDHADAYDKTTKQKRIWIRPVRSFGGKKESFGWILGNPVLDSKASWPMRDSKPYDFLCQLNCEKIPKNLWKGLGPRKGWLSVFFAPTTEHHAFDTKIVYSRDWGTEIEPPLSHIPAHHRHIDPNYRSYLLPDMALELKPFSPEMHNGKPILPNWMLSEPHADEPFLLSDPMNQPADWDELELLIKVIIEENDKAYPDRQQRKQRLEDRTELTEHDEANLAFFSSWLANAPGNREVLTARLASIKGLKSTQPFNTDTWHDFYTWLDEIMSERFGLWHFHYEAIREQRTLYKLFQDSASVPIAVRNRFDAIWRYKDERTSFQIGGGPVGYSGSFFENALTNVFLLNATSSRVHALDFHGSSLNVSIPISSLLTRSFKKVSSDIAN